MKTEKSQSYTQWLYLWVGVFLKFTREWLLKRHYPTHNDWLWGRVVSRVHTSMVTESLGGDDQCMPSLSSNGVFISSYELYDLWPHPFQLKLECSTVPDSGTLAVGDVRRAKAGCNARSCVACIGRSTRSCVACIGRSARRTCANL